MSLINDALKQARKAPPRNLPTAIPPPQPVTHSNTPMPAWLLPAMVILLIGAAIAFIGWANSHHGLRTNAAAPTPPSIVAEPVPPKTVASAPPSSAAPALPKATPITTAISQPEDKPNPMKPPPPPKPPKLQGIFYSPAAPSAIVDGQSVRLGDQIGEYRVKAITKSTVILIGPDGQETKLSMGN